MPWAPDTDRAAEAVALAGAPALARTAAAGAGGMAEHLDEVPVLLLVLVDLSKLATVDRDLPRYTFAGGASIYPFVWSILLAARQEDLRGVVTTMPIRRESEVRRLFAIPEHFAVAALVALGRPTAAPRRLRRRPVAEFARLDRFDGPPLGL